MKRILLIILAIGLIGAFITWKYVFRKSETSVASQKAEVEITAAELLNAYEMDEANANIQYLNKIILVEGVVSEMKTDSTGTSVYLKEPDALSGILCGFNKATKISDKLVVGNKVKIKGLCTGYLMDVVLNKCSLE